MKILDRIIITVAFFFIYFHIGGLATTNILRLTKGNKLPVLSSTCVCNNCGERIKPLYQLPIVSFLLCKGKCRNCRMKIPVGALALEVVVLTGMFAVSVLFSFSYIGVTFSFVYYEAVRVLVIMKNGKRESDFVKQYIIAVAAMIPFYLITLFVGMIYKAVC